MPETTPPPCRHYASRDARGMGRADRLTELRDRIANVTSVRRSYQRALDGETASKLPRTTLLENIERTTRRLAELHSELSSLEP